MIFFHCFNTQCFTRFHLVTIPVMQWTLFNICFVNCEVINNKIIHLFLLHHRIIVMITNFISYHWFHTICTIFFTEFIFWICTQFCWWTHFSQASSRIGDLSDNVEDLIGKKKKWLIQMKKFIFIEQNQSFWSDIFFLLHLTLRNLWRNNQKLKLNLC